ncbi:MAG: hypothetical protein LBG78_08025 [Azoarcus sp.]|jgi:hypothetical protein|nr:hypothetical protein [Azoarcus sp.]
MIDSITIVIGVGLGIFLTVLGIDEDVAVFFAVIICLTINLLLNHLSFGKFTNLFQKPASPQSNFKARYSIFTALALALFAWAQYHGYSVFDDVAGERASGHSDVRRVFHK